MSQHHMILLIGLAALFVLSSCSDDVSREDLEPRAPLEHCTDDSQCTDGTTCECGICTVECADQPDRCDAFGSGVGCASGDAPNAVCDGPDGAPDSMCSRECTSNNDCDGLDVCTAGYCEPKTSRDEYADWDDRCGTGDFPPCCSDGETGDLFGGNVREHPGMEFRLEGMEAPDEAWTATWQGVVDLDESHELECPTGAEEVGVLCEVSYAIRLDSPASDILVGLPRETLESLAEPGDEVELNLEQYEPTQLTIRDSSGAILLDMVMGYTGPYNRQTVKFRREEYVVEMPGLDDDFSNVICMTQKDMCRHEYSPRTVLFNSANRTTEFAPYTTGSVQVLGEPYRFRHFASHNRLPSDVQACADAYRPHLQYALTRTPSPD